MYKTEVISLIKTFLTFKSLRPHTAGLYDELYILEVQIE